MRSDLYRKGDIEKVSVVNGSLEDFATLERAINLHEVHTVLHLGAQTIVTVAHRYPLATLEANVRGTYNLLEACRTHAGRGVGVVVASSDKAYGEQEVLPYTEDMTLAGSFPYEVSKSCADMLAQSYHRSYGLPVAIARCGNVYGGNDLNFSRIIPGTIKLLLKGESPIIRSDGTFVRDYVYVKDIVSAYMSLARRVASEGVNGEAFNFSAEKPLSVVEIVETIQQIMGLEHLAPVMLDDVTGEIRSQYLDAGKAARVLGWKPGYSLEEGLRETVAWYEDYFRIAKPGARSASD
jgi:CDP-glucose 4,6-dehydratase